METTEKNMEHGEHFNESIVNEVSSGRYEKEQDRSYEISSGNGSTGRIRRDGSGYFCHECL